MSNLYKSNHVVCNHSYHYLQVKKQVIVIYVATAINISALFDFAKEYDLLHISYGLIVVQPSMEYSHFLLIVQLKLDWLKKIQLMLCHKQTIIARVHNVF